MKNQFTTSIVNRIFTVLGATTVALSGNVIAQQDISDYTAEPAIVQTAELAPKVMLSMSMDHQLFIKAYNDYDDIYDDPNTTADDGVAETTYTHAYKYVGYFDNTKCYEYDADEEIFTPIGATATDGYCTDAVGGGWSGNFLNWLTMTRIDLVRYVLYGGYRSTDSVDETVLERSYLPNDSHSFAKFYDRTDINDLTDGLTNDGGYTFCNTSKPPSRTDDAQKNAYSQDIDTSTSPPLLRVVKGDYSMWASGERFQCLAGGTNGEWTGLSGINGSTGKNGNVPDATGMTAAASSPTAADGITDMNVRVRACVTNDGSSNCKSYDNGAHFKPIGLLHEYGEAGTVEFGLLTGSYASNKDWGVLRSNVHSFTDEVNHDTGQFSKTATETATSIVANLDAFRIIDYRFNGGISGSYMVADSGKGITDCRYGAFSFSNGNCRNWGNPFSEILAESYRYFSGATAASVSEADINKEKAILSSLTVDKWQVNADDEEADKRFACSNLNVLGINASTVSYDDDKLSGISINGDNGLLGANASNGSSTDTIDKLTDDVGGTSSYGEMLAGSYFVGGIVGSAVDNECTAKTVADGAAFSKVRGTCPEAPRLNGTYLGSGLAHYFHTKADRKISTYGVTMAGATPNIKVKVSGNQEIVIIPACRNWSGGASTLRTTAPGGRCALAAFKAIGEVTDKTGKYLIGWEDTEQGGDYDMDMWGILEYNYSANKLTIVTKLVDESTGDKLDFGFIISGTKTASDGAYYPAYTRSDDGPQDGFLAADTVDANGRLVETTTTVWCKDSTGDNNPNPNKNPTCSDSILDEGGKKRFVQTTEFDITTIGDSTAGTFLEEPLYYAAKWGSFEDKSGGVSDIPDTDAEWRTADGDLKGYTSVSDPAKLTEKMKQIFKSLLERPSVATATGVSLSSSTGVGLLVNSLYYPKLESGDNKVEWVGSLSGMLRDVNGNLREDTNGNGYVDQPDSVIKFVRDSNGVTKVTRTIDFGGLRQQTVDTTMESVSNLWDAQNELAAISDFTTQRAYTASAATGRYIFTGERVAGVPQITKTVDFTSTAGDLAVFKTLLDIDADKQADLVNYIRGVEGAGMRSRTLDGVKHLLGDTVNSSPKIVGRPQADYDILKNDQSYEIFRKRYKNRRQVVYVGANDGMLHAFNAGFQNTTGIGFNTGGATDVKHPLGSELWAYVPYNLLPHLKWLASRDYSHVFYMDGEIQEFDVNIFEDDSETTNIHPGGWGTIIVAGMRLGGKLYSVGEEDLKSAYVIMDVTNPEVAPKLLAEVTAEGMGFTTANAQLIVNRTPRAATYTMADNTDYTDKEMLKDVTVGTVLNATAAQLIQLEALLEGLSEEEVNANIAALIRSTASAATARQNSWYLLFGSGPTELSSATSLQPAKLFYLDLNNLTQADANPTLTSVDFAAGIEPAITDAFVGGITVVDWTGDFKDDAIYFGLVENSEIAVDENATPPILEAVPVRGRLMQANVKFVDGVLAIKAPTQLMTGPGATSYPFSTKPFAIQDADKHRWVYAGSGRFYVSSDSGVSSGNGNTYVGLVVNNGNGGIDGNGPEVSTTDLLDVTDVRLYVENNDKVNHEVRAISPSTLPLPEDLISAAPGGKVTLSVLDDYISNTKSGWIRDFESETEFVSVNTAFVNESLVVNSYDPYAEVSGAAACLTPSGASYGYVFDMLNGLPQIDLTNLDYNEDDPTETTSRRVTYYGYTSSPTIITGTKTVIPSEVDGEPPVKDGSGTESLSNTGGSTKGGDLDTFDVNARRQSWREIYLDELN